MSETFQSSRAPEPVRAFPHEGVGELSPLEPVAATSLTQP